MFPSLVEHPPCSMPSSSNEPSGGTSNVRELNPWRLENLWRPQGNIGGADGYSSSELSSDDDESTDDSGITDGATGDPSYDVNDVLCESDGDSYPLSPVLPPVIRGPLMEQPGTRVMIQRVNCGSTDADLYPPSRQNQQADTPTNRNYIIGPPIDLAEVLRMKPHLCAYFSTSTLDAVMADANPNPPPGQPESVIWF